MTTLAIYVGVGLAIGILTGAAFNFGDPTEGFRNFIDWVAASVKTAASGRVTGSVETAASGRNKIEALKVTPDRLKPIDQDCCEECDNDFDKWFEL